MYNIDPEDITQYVTPVGKIPRYIVCAANRYNDTIICGARHCDDIMMNVSKLIPEFNMIKAEQGFIDQYQNFVTREDAAVIVATNKQKLRDPKVTDWLFSENLY